MHSKELGCLIKRADGFAAPVHNRFQKLIFSTDFFLTSTKLNKHIGLHMAPSAQVLLLLIIDGKFHGPSCFWLIAF